MLERTPRSPGLLDGELFHAQVVGVVHVVMEGIRGAATASTRGAAEIGGGLRQRVTDEIAIAVAAWVRLDYHRSSLD